MTTRFRFWSKRARGAGVEGIGGRIATVAFAVLVTCGATPAALAAGPPGPAAESSAEAGIDVADDAEVGSMRALVAAGVHPDLAWMDFAAVRAPVAAFYERRSWAPAWFASGVPTPQARGMALLLRDAARKGLDPTDYDGALWPERLDGAACASGTGTSDLRRVDVAFSVSVARYASDVRSGRVDPRRVRFELPADPDRPAVADMLDAIAAASDVAAAVDALEPPFEPYRRTVRALERELDAAARGGAGARDAAGRARRLALTLERWRWLPRRFESPPVVVNIPQFELHTTGAAPLTLRVVVGRSVLRYRTPVFAASITEVLFRPYWNVPRSIARDELAPKLARNPAALEREGYELLDRDGRRVALGPAAADGLSSGELRIRQRPGPSNALGLVKFVMPNRHDVYLHATPAQRLFQQPRRAASHGCIRVEHPERLAAWVLRDEPETWTPERIGAAMNGERTFAVPLARAIPVLVVYATATVDATGRVRVSGDVYGYDAELERALAARRARASAQPLQSPVADGPGVDVDEVRRGVVADAAGAE